MVNLINTVLQNRFRVLSFVASGGMSAVYRVWDIQRNTHLAMKVLHQDLQDDPSIQKRFRREARALQKLAHPHIVKFYGLYETPDFSFLIEDFIEGPTLKQVMKRRKDQPLPVDFTLAVLKALSAALGYAHSQGVIHCDVKPGNVMLDRAGNIYLADFGIARHADSTTTTLASIGTAAYMSPEQIRGEAVTPQTDIYAMGIMLYEMVTGRRPFSSSDESSGSSGGTANERLRIAHLSQPPEAPHLCAPNVSKELSQAILKALEKEPAKRYLSIQEFFETISFAAGFQPSQISDRASVDFLNQMWGDVKVENGGAIAGSPIEIPKTTKKMIVTFAVLAAALVGLCLISFSIKNSTKRNYAPREVAPVGIDYEATSLILQKEQTQHADQIMQNAIQATIAVQTLEAEREALNQNLSNTARAVQKQAPVTEKPLVIIITNTPQPRPSQPPPTNTRKPAATSTNTVVSVDRFSLYYPLEKCAPSYLRKGLWAYVSFGGGANAIRSFPDTGPRDNIIGRAQPGDLIEIIGGPECNYGWILWEVNAYTKDGILTGWTPETPDGKEFWLSPCPSKNNCPP